MRISKRTREQAAIICSIMASHGGRRAIFDAEKALLGRTWHPAGDVASDCAHHVWRVAAVADGAQRWAEAESLLRTGWSP